MNRVVVAVALASVCCLGVGARAQEQRGGAGARTGVARSLESVLQRMRKDLGVSFLADSSLASAQASLPEDATTPANVEDQLDALVKQLPRGTVWAKVMLPEAKGRRYRGDDVLDYVLAQARLFGNVGSTKAGTVEILGQKIEEGKAEPVVGALGLRPVYLLANPSARGARGAEGDLLPDAQIDQMVQGMRSLMSLDPQQRGPAIQKMFRSFGEMLQTLSPEQRRDFIMTMRGGLGGERPRP